jgi:hypothetical protein
MSSSLTATIFSLLIGISVAFYQMHRLTPFNAKIFNVFSKKGYGDRKSWRCRFDRVHTLAAVSLYFWTPWR